MLLGGIKRERMNQDLQSILDIIKPNGSLSADDMDAIVKAANAIDKKLTIVEFKLKRIETVKRTTEFLLEETIEELEQKGKVVEESRAALQKSLEKLEAAKDQLVQQEKLASLGQLTAGIAHEIKNPLNFVNNFSELSMELIEEIREEVKRQKADAGAERRRGVSDAAGDEAFDTDLILEILDDIEANLKTIHKHGTRADSIVKSMLHHSRGGDGKMEPTPLNPIIKEYVNLAFHGMRAGKNSINVTIDLQLDERVGEMPLIAEDFSRVVLNLVNNAFDAMREKMTGDGRPETEGNSPTEGSAEAERRRGVSAMDVYDPKLTVRTRRDENAVTIEIEDNGPGIPDELKDKILQPFFTTKKGTQGTGLGLSITNDIIKAHGGTMEVYSEPGKTQIRIILNR